MTFRNGPLIYLISHRSLKVVDNRLVICFPVPPFSLAFSTFNLQAMDRAHRLGQKKVVNVHRLIMRGTLEEKVMSLQKFKLSVANAVINAENASMKTMNTDQLLDLFATAETSKKVLLAGLFCLLVILLNLYIVRFFMLLNMFGYAC